MKILITKLGLFLTVGSPSLYDLHGKSQMNKSQSHETLTLYILEKLRYINYARIRFFFLIGIFPASGQNPEIVLLKENLGL